MRELCTLLTTQAQEFDLRAGDSSIAFNAYKGGVSQASADLDAAELKRIRVRLVASPTGACTTAAGSKHCLVQARKGHGMVQREDSRYVCGDDCSDDPIPCVCVTGFHHTGTTLLRHILGARMILRSNSTQPPPILDFAPSLCVCDFFFFFSLTLIQTFSRVAP